jgi:hypothetical protein
MKVPDELAHKEKGKVTPLSTGRGMSDNQGKGTWRRPTRDERQLAHNWCWTFGHRWVAGVKVCANGCGKKKRARRVSTAD